MANKEYKHLFKEENSHWRSQFGHRGWIRPTVLRLLEESPMKGIEIMDKLEEKTKGWWRPSPGSIYPLLTELEQEGLVKKGSEGRYAVTGKYGVDDGPSEIGSVLTNMEGNATYLEEVVSSDKSALKDYKKRVAKLSERLKKLQ